MNYGVNYELAHIVDCPANRIVALRLVERFIKKAQGGTFTEAEGFIISAKNMAVPRDSWDLTSKQIEDHVRLMNLLHKDYLAAAEAQVRIMRANA